jgi:hypothetical protein
MPKPPSPRIILRVRADGSHTLFTRNLGALRRKLGPDVFNCFTRAFLLIDRLDSLVDFEHLTLANVPASSKHQQRNHFVFLVFVMGTMFELSQVLSQLRGALAKASLLDSGQWTRKLGDWDKRWRTDPIASAFRNEVAFHIDGPFVEKGLDALSQVGLVEVFGADDPPSRQSGTFSLGSEAVIRGLGLSPAKPEEFFSRPIPDLAVYDPLTTIFLSTLERAGLEPAVERKPNVSLQRTRYARR